MDLTAQDVRDVRFGTTRMRAGYQMAEVDAFLDTIETAVGSYARELQDTRDEAEALRSQVQQLQGRLATVQAELDECRVLAAPQGQSDGHDTVITEIERAHRTQTEADVETTAETPVVRSGPAESPLAMLQQVRDDVRMMLSEQLRLVDELDLDED